MSGEAIERKLDTIITILRLGYRKELEEVRASIKGDPGRAAVLDAASSGWVGGGALVKAAATRANKSARSIQRCVAGLSAEGVLEKRGAGPRVEYRVAGVI